MDTFMQTQTDDLTFRWHGGEYIDVGSMYSVDGQSGIDGDDFHAYDVINVWDYELGRPRIPVTLEAMAARVAEYIASQESDDDR